MDATTLQILASSPVYLVLIYLTFKQQAQIEKLLTQICEINAQHSKDMLELQTRMLGRILLEEPK